MHHLVYVSLASTNQPEATLLLQLNHWRATNARLNITGLLLLSDAGDIMQVLEGEQATVHTLYAVIAADRRHRSVVKLADGPIPTRAFANWSMHFRTVPATDFTRLVPQPGPAHARNLLPLLETFMNEKPVV